MALLEAGYRRYRAGVFAGQAERAARLAHGQQPPALFIGCADSRVVPELITGSEPGELFVVRTAGNLVPPYGPGTDGVAASIEYAVAVLGVAEVVVCGHSGCGAMTALADPGADLTGLPAVASWLRYADAARSADPGDGLPELIRRNVEVQLANLRTHPAVSGALRAGALTLHGWVYDIASGDLDVLHEDRFVRLDPHH